MNKIQQTKKLMLVMIGGLFLSGITVFPVETELKCLLKILPEHTGMHTWIQFVFIRFCQVKLNYPQFIYGYDWLGFAHIVLAILFIGPYKDPVKNIWVIEFGMIASVLIFPFSFIAGYFREIPFGWQLIDCSFGVAAYILLYLGYRNIQSLKK